MTVPIFKAFRASFPKLPQPFTFEIQRNAKTVVYGPSKRFLLQLISGQVTDPSKHISFPGIGRDFWPSQVIEFVSFGQSNSASARAPFIGARYESFRDEFDDDLLTVLRSGAPKYSTEEDIERVSEILDLTSLWNNWFVGLSNGQSRRAQLAQALLRKPKLLVIDEPFLGLDPSNREKFSNILSELPVPVVMGLRAGEIAPHYVTQTLFADVRSVFEGKKALELIKLQVRDADDFKVLQKQTQLQRNQEKDSKTRRSPIIEMKDVTISFKNADKPIFNKLNLCVFEGERVHIQGPNGSGKTTLLALITADHPQSWSKDIFLFGEKLKVGTHSYFSINERIGHSSPEIHAIFPKFLNASRAISTGFSGSMIPPSTLTIEQRKTIENVAESLQIDLTDPTKFGEMSLGKQKLILLARALVKTPQILILDEAFSTLEKDQRLLAFNIVNKFKGSLLVVGHLEEEIPVCDKVIRLGGT